MNIMCVSQSMLREIKIPFYYGDGILAVHQAYYDVGFRTDRWNVTHKHTGARVGPIFADMGSAMIYCNRLDGMIPKRVTHDDVVNQDIKDVLMAQLYGLEYTYDYQPASIEGFVRASVA